MRVSRTNVVIATAIGIATLVVVGLSRLASAPKVLAAGRFHQVAHKGSGIASVCETADGRRVLRLMDFRTADRSDLYVLLVSAPDALENETVKRAETVSLGPLRSAEGNQEYDVPDEVDLARFRAVTVWSTKYQVNFTTAPLAPSALVGRF